MAVVRRRKVRNCPEFINRAGAQFESGEKTVRRGVRKRTVPAFYSHKKEFHCQGEKSREVFGGERIIP